MLFGFFVLTEKQFEILVCFGVFEKLDSPCVVSVYHVLVQSSHLV